MRHFQNIISSYLYTCINVPSCKSTCYGNFPQEISKYGLFSQTSEGKSNTLGLKSYLDLTPNHLSGVTKLLLLNIKSWIILAFES